VRVYVRVIYVCGRRALKFWGVAHAHTYTHMYSRAIVRACVCVCLCVWTANVNHGP